MAISFVNAATNNSTAAVATFTVTRPTNTAAGNIMFAFVSRQNAATGTSLADWTLIEEVLQADGQDGSLAVYWKTAADGDPATWTGDLLTSNAKYCCTCVSHGGIKSPSGWVDGTNYAMNTNTLNQSSYTSDSLTVNSGEWILGAVNSGFTSAFNGTWNDITNYTERAEVDADDGTAGIDHQVVDSAGSALTGSQSITFTATAAHDNGTAFIARLEPLGAPIPGRIFGTVW